MKNLVNNIFTVICLVTLAANLNACGKADISAVTPMNVAPQYQVATLDEAPIQDQLLVKFKNNLSKNSIDKFHSKYGTRTLRVIPGINVHVVETPVDIKAAQLIKYLGNDSLVQYAELNHSVQLNPDRATNPVYSINSNLNYGQLIGKQMDVSGVYSSSRSGAIITTKDAKLSVVDLDGSVVTKLPGMTEGSRVKITGIIKTVKGFNLTKNLGIMPVAFNNAK